MADLSPIHVTPDLDEFVAERVASGEFTSLSQYVSSLIEADRRKRIVAHVEKLVIEGLESEPVEVDDEFWDERVRRLERSLKESDSQ